ncbi:RNA polymerase II-associated protein 3 [Uranotaenia lowii]|uniref:RNA polymerase II-associated protein 3 n=1 Tax=Uranotaenia lowii TaxID=190385 RepID=UPI0024787883|nr:RNA polymerase II-associated protein 3 [Uranotaenia lowii]
MSNAIEAQLGIKAKCEQMQQCLKEQYEWEKEMKQKEALARQQQADGENLSPPIRSQIGEMYKYLQEQSFTEKKKSSLSNHINTSNMVQESEDLVEADRLFGLGNEFCKRAKESEDPVVFKERYGHYAIDMYTRAIQLNSKKADYFFHRALCFFKMEQFEDCLKDCDAALDLDKSSVKVYLCRMQAFEYMGENKKAYLEGKYLLKIAKDTKDLDRTKQDIARIEKRMRHDGDVHKAEGNDHLKNKNYLKAQECFTKAINSFPFEPIYYHNRSMAYFHLNQHGHCLEDANKAIELDSNYHRPYYQRMRLREISGDYNGAINDCKKFLELVRDVKQQSTAKKDLAKLQSLLEQKGKPPSYNWNDLRKNATITNFVQKPPHLRSKKPLKRIQIAEVCCDAPNSFSPLTTSDYESIPEAVIDEIFNNNTGERLAEPTQDMQLDNLFSSSPDVSNRLRQFFSPPTTPSSPPSNLLSQKSPETSHQETSSIECRETKNLLPEVTKEAEKPPAKQEKNNSIERSDIDLVKLESDNPFPSIPPTTVQFYHIWNKLETPHEKFIFLKSLENQPLHELLGATMGSAMLTDILQVLAKNCAANNYSPLKIMQQLAKCQRMDILLPMMNEIDKYSMIKLFELLDTMEKDSEQASAVKKSLIV